MTAEIVVMNKRAVALATDSAVTIGYPGNPKIYNSANKLFMLSKYHPVGIMFYGAAEFMDLPWETLVSVYRTQLIDAKFDTLRDYAEDFLRFLASKDSPILPQGQQGRYFRYILEAIRNHIYEIFLSINAISQISEAESREIADTIVESYYNQWKEAEVLPQVPSGYLEDTLSEYQSAINALVDELFDMPISKDAIGQLIEICKWFTKDIFVNNAGVVFAGFGDQDVFPSVFSYEVDAVINYWLKFKPDKSCEISFDGTQSAIIPFAQSEMVYTFMEGIDPRYERELFDYLGRIFSRYPEAVLAEVPKLEDDTKAELLERLTKLGDTFLADFETESRNYRQQYNAPIRNNVNNLPLDELASMAESLVNITSFKRRVSIEQETVGGPIDVAVISKKDGFIWMKRKHYFDANYNQHFFVNYYRQE